MGGRSASRQSHPPASPALRICPRTPGRQLLVVVGVTPAECLDSFLVDIRVQLSESIGCLVSRRPEVTYTFSRIGLIEIVRQCNSLRKQLDCLVRSVTFNEKAFILSRP
jgi:hypothetical protein